MDKPISLSVKDYLIRKMAVKMMLSEKTIEGVINHQFQSSSEALLNNKSIELSGFGKFYFNDSRAMKRMEKYLSQVDVFTRMMNDESLSEQKRAGASMKLNTALSNIEALKPKLYEYRSDLRGVEKQVDSPKGSEESDRGDIRGEN